MRNSSGAVRFQATEMMMTSKAVAMSACSAGFLAAGASQLDRWSSLTSNFMEQFKVGFSGHNVLSSMTILKWKNVENIWGKPSVHIVWKQI
jgi:hypothetical protein